ncbi:peptide chain release factor family protein [Photobacterium alginatilyticum]|uniref:peptide chain release factor family protein n=1 Tax=Photobacterium alginatilyticum TaxID=1775171 RepID=UPI004068EAF3
MINLPLRFRFFRSDAPGQVGQGAPSGQGVTAGHDRIKTLPVSRTPSAVRLTSIQTQGQVQSQAQHQTQNRAKAKALSPLSSIALGQWYRAEQGTTPATISALHCQQLGQFLTAQTTPEAKQALEVVQALWLVQREIHLIKSGLMGP